MASLLLGLRRFLYISCNNKLLKSFLPLSPSYVVSKSDAKIVCPF